MIKEFFLDKFEYDVKCNARWIKTMQEHEDKLPQFVMKSFSHIINVHHIWINRILEQPIESNSWDLLPIDYWEKLTQEYYLKTEDYLEKNEFNGKVEYTSEEGVPLEKDVIDILYHILNHSNYHRGQISLELKNAGIRPPVFNFVSYK